MGNCLVTKLKGSVQDNNLPELNTIYFDYVGSKLSSVTSDRCFIYLTTGGYPVNYTLKTAMHKDSTTGTLVTEGTVAANSNLILTALISDLGTSDIKEFLKLDGGVYDIVKLAMPGFSFVCALDFAPTKRNNIQCLQYAENLLCYGGLDVDFNVVPNTVKCLSIGNTKDVNSISLDGCPSGVQIIVASKLLNGVLNGQIFIMSEYTKSLQDLRVINGRVSGLITNAPTSLRSIAMNGSAMTGAIEDWVALARAAGRTTGCIAFRSPDSAWNITYGGVALKNAGVPKVNDWGYLTWTSDSMSWESSQPEGMAQYTTDIPSIISFVPYT